MNTLRSNRNNDFSRITKEFEKTTSNNHADDRFWKPERDKAGNATATIRFLPRAHGDELPWVKLFSHGFKNDSTGRWFIEDCLTTLTDETGTSLQCPVCAHNTVLWNSTTDENSPIRKTVRNQKRKLSYISNILVINDPKHPENNGRVFLFKYGKRIFDKIMDKARPTFEDEQPVNVFDYWDGANFKLRMKNVDGYPNYDSSEFESVAPIGTDEDILAVANQQHKLADLVDKSKFKSYADLERKLNFVLATAAPATRAEDMVKMPTPVAPKEPKSAPAPTAKSVDSDGDEDSDMMNYFQQLADDDAPF